MGKQRNQCRRSSGSTSKILNILILAFLFFFFFFFPSLGSAASVSSPKYVSLIITGKHLTEYVQKRCTKLSPVIKNIWLLRAHYTTHLFFYFLFLQSPLLNLEAAKLYGSSRDISSFASTHFLYWCMKAQYGTKADGGKEMKGRERVAAVTCFVRVSVSAGRRKLSIDSWKSPVLFLSSQGNPVTAEQKSETRAPSTKQSLPQKTREWKCKMVSLTRGYTLEVEQSPKQSKTRKPSKP